MYAASEASSVSRRGSHIDTAINPVPPHPPHVQFHRHALRSLSLSRSRQNSIDVNSRQARKSTEVKMANETSEASPLLTPQRDDEDGIGPEPLTQILSVPESELMWPDDHGKVEESKSSLYLALLTIAIGGLQIAWCVELSYGSPYLLGLGISKSLLAIVWIAGPLSGTLVQPYIGIKSDRCRSRFGRRRPFIVGGAAATIISLMALAWAREIIGGILHAVGNSSAVMTTTIVFAVVVIYVLDFSINVIQAAIRAFIVDNAPTHQQDSANAWASRMTGVGNIIGYSFGYVDLPRSLWFFGDTQFKILCVIASLALITTVAISCLTVRERDPRLDGEPSKDGSGLFGFFKSLWRSVRQLPKQISRVCQVQFFAWIGWFPFLFYTTTYVSEIYVQPIFAENPNMTQDQIDAVWAEATRIGTFAMLIFAITTFASSVFIPFFVAGVYREEENSNITPLVPGMGDRASEFLDSNNVMNETRRTNKRGLARWMQWSSLQRISVRSIKPKIPWLTLRRTWMFSHIVFAILMWSTFAVHDTKGATILIALVGMPWAITNWVPYALIAADLGEREKIRTGLIKPSTTDESDLSRVEDQSQGTNQAGVVLGIHNVAIAAPQIIATLVSSAIFSALQKPRGSVGDESVAWVFRFGGCCAVIAAYMTTRVGEQKRT